MKNQNLELNDARQYTGLGLKGRLVAGFVTIILIFVISVALTLMSLWRVHLDTNSLLNNGVKTESILNDMERSFSSGVLLLQSYVVFHDADKKQPLERSLGNLDNISIDAQRNVSNLNNQSIFHKWSTLLNNLKRYQALSADTIELASAGKSDAAVDLYKREILPLIPLIYSGFNSDSDINSNDQGILDIVGLGITHDTNDIKHQIEKITLSTLILLIIAIILSVIITKYTSRSIINPIKFAIDIANRIASGERDMNISSSRIDETGQLIDALAVMRDSIKSGEVLKKQYAEDIMRACTSMVSTLDEVRHAVDAQSSGASEQASSINEITASISEIEKSAIQTMNKARDLGGVAEKTRTSGQKGLEAIESSVAGMSEVRDKVQLIAQTILDLSRQTQQVGEITSVVNNLAQQSKMLALNASIEAAKAGDAGKGFTVVANEVKNLAEQSEQSTLQVQKILEDIKVATEKAVMVTEEGTKGVDAGLQMIEKTGEIIRSLNEVIREATIASQQIEAAVRQESAGIEQITTGMNEINTVTTSFVSSVAQTTEAMNDLANVSNKLKDSVETYNN